MRQWRTAASNLHIRLTDTEFRRDALNKATARSVLAMILFGERDCVCDSGLQSRGKVARPDSVVQFCPSDSTKPILYNQGHYQITEGQQWQI